ncbi:Thermophilic serine proteinase [Metarhizium brunneum]|uniref:Thermophilic serine proteinase n=1 Tax=Metarhizium brunneum TaxID=500148 RepID=A0A7D5UUN1_9HYPO
MIRLSLPTLAWLTITAVAGTKAPSTSSVHDYIVECESSVCVEQLANNVQEKGGQVRHKFNSDVFHGVSVQLESISTAEQTMAELEELEGIRGVWPVQASTPAVKVGQENQKLGAAGNLHSGDTQRHGAGKRAADDLWPHLMTHVDKLHKKGFSGQGIKIAVVDTGIDYTHPALGGCFGKGCRVAFGDNFSKDGEKGDPMDCYGHGTEVAGVLAGYSRDQGFVGAAPNATLMAYRVLDCSAEGTEDDMMAGWLKAYEDRAQIIVSSTGIQGSGWAQGPLAMVASRIAARGVTCVGGLGNMQEQGLFYAMAPATGDGVVSVNSVASDYTVPYLSAYGPTWDLGIKPNVIAPGQGIWVTEKHGRYTYTSGTSYATPLVGGIAALVAEARGGSFNGVLINNLLMSTAKPQRDNGAFMSVAQQGGGLVDAWEAAHATTLVEPAGLEFNDTEHRVPISLKITNTAKSEVSYELSHLAATTLYTFSPGGTKPGQGEHAQATADIKLSLRSFTLGPGQSATVDVSAEEPLGLDASRLPLWSGWVAITGSDGTNLTAPYLGLSGSLRSATSLHPNTLRVRWADPNNVTPLDKNASVVFLDPPSGQRPGSPASIGELTQIFSGNLFFRLSLLASPQVLMDIVPLDLCPLGTDTSTVQGPPDLSMNCVPSSMVKDSRGLKSIGQVAGFPRYYASRNAVGVEGEWDGAYAKGQYAPPGRYKIVARALAVFGDASNPSDWQLTESPAVFILYLHNYIPVAQPTPEQA